MNFDIRKDIGNYVVSLCLVLTILSSIEQITEYTRIAISLPDTWNLIAYSIYSHVFAVFGLEFPRGFSGLLTYNVLLLLTGFGILFHRRSLATHQEGKCAISIYLNLALIFFTAAFLFPDKMIDMITSGPRPYSPSEKILAGFSLFFGFIVATIIIIRSILFLPVYKDRKERILVGGFFVFSLYFLMMVAIIKDAHSVAGNTELSSRDIFVWIMIFSGSSAWVIQFLFYVAPVDRLAKVTRWSVYTILGIVMVGFVLGNLPKL